MADDLEEKRPTRRIACEVYSRIVGYLRPVQDWNRGKQQEFAERKTYAVPDSAPPADKGC
jgi:anaerobic ribonucleoside-triphosphate reductase